MDEQFDVAGRTRHRTVHPTEHDRTTRRQLLVDLGPHPLANGLVAHDTLAARHLVTSGLELRLDQPDHCGGGSRQRQQRWRHGAQRDERQVSDDNVERTADRRPVGVAHVHSLVDDNALIVAQLLVELTVTDIDGDDAPRPTLEEAIGEPTGRRASVECDKTSHIDAELVEGGVELVAASADEAAHPDEGDWLVSSDEAAGLEGRCTGNGHEPGIDDVVSLGAAAGESPAHELGVEPAAGCHAQRFLAALALVAPDFFAGDFVAADVVAADFVAGDVVPARFAGAARLAATFVGAAFFEAAVFLAGDFLAAAFFFAGAVRVAPLDADAAALATTA